MLNLDPSKMVVIAILAVVLLGPEKLPSAARHLGLAWRALSRWRERVEVEVRSTIPNLPATEDLNQMLRNPVTLLNRLAPAEEPVGLEDPGPLTAGLSDAAILQRPAASSAEPPEVTPLVPR